MFAQIMPPDSVQAIILLIAFFMPGFIAGKVFELCFPRTEATARLRMLEYLTLSLVNYALWSWLVVLVIRGQLWQEQPVWFALYTVLVLLISPVLLGFFMAIATEKHWFQEAARRLGVQAPYHIGTAWEWFFRRYHTSRWWVIIRLRSGTMVYGFFGWNSYTGNIPTQRDLYLEKECRIDINGKLQLVKDTGGVYVRYTDIEAIAFRPVKEERKERQQIQEET